MANTFSQIYLQFVFAVKNRQCLIASENKEELHKYITGLVQNRKAKMLAVQCMRDHIQVAPTEPGIVVYFVAINRKLLRSIKNQIYKLKGISGWSFVVY